MPKRGAVAARRTHQDGIGLADCPDVDLFIITAGDQHARRFSTDLQAVDRAVVGGKLVCAVCRRRRRVGAQRRAAARALAVAAPGCELRPLCCIYRPPIASLLLTEFVGPHFAGPQAL